MVESFSRLEETSWREPMVRTSFRLVSDGFMTFFGGPCGINVVCECQGLFAKWRTGLSDFLTVYSSRNSSNQEQTKLAGNHADVAHLVVNCLPVFMMFMT